MEKLKRFLKFINYSIKGVARDFDESTLPWIDKATDKEIDEFVASHDFSDFPFDMKEKLKFWNKNGYVIFENAIPKEWIDKQLTEIEELYDNHQNFQTSILVQPPDNSWKKNPEQKIKDVPLDVLRGKGIKLNDFYNTSEVSKKIMLHPTIIAFLKTLFSDRPVGMQSLNFHFGSQQPAHMDFPYVVSGIPSHLAAAWIALEDIHPDSGPLFYYVGSHRMKKFNWGNGIIYHIRESFYTPLQFADWLEKNCKKNGYKKEVLLLKKGDVLIWHAALVHGGTPINNPEQSRKSYVCHYSSQTAYPTHRFAPDQKPVEVVYGDGMCYEHPTLKDEENYFKAM